jgi:hypothetical protein
MTTTISICQDNAPLNSMENRCRLLEKLDVDLLSADISGVSYRNNDVALSLDATHRLAFT